MVKEEKNINEETSRWDSFFFSQINLFGDYCWKNLSNQYISEKETLATAVKEQILLLGRGN